MKVVDVLKLTLFKTKRHRVTSKHIEDFVIMDLDEFSCVHFGTDDVVE